MNVLCSHVKFGGCYLDYDDDDDEHIENITTLRGNEIIFTFLQGTN